MQRAFAGNLQGFVDGRFERRLLTGHVVGGHFPHHLHVTVAVLKAVGIACSRPDLADITGRPDVVSGGLQLWTDQNSPLHVDA